MLTSTCPICIFSLSQTHVFGEAKFQTYLVAFENRTSFLILSLRQYKSEGDRRKVWYLRTAVLRRARLEFAIRIGRLLAWLSRWSGPMLQFSFIVISKFQILRKHTLWSIFVIIWRKTLGEKKRMKIELWRPAIRFVVCIPLRTWTILLPLQLVGKTTK